MKRVAALGFILAVAGCQSSDSGNVLNVAADKPKQEEQERISAAELRAYCPRVTLRSGTAYYNTYAKGGQDDPSKLLYQASITDVTRSCAYGDGTVTMTVAAAGKVVPGPAGQGGTVTMPIRIAAVRGEEVLYSQLHKYAVQIAAGAGATQFVFTDPAAVIPTPTARNIEVFVGFDEGPYDTP